MVPFIDFLNHDNSYVDFDLVYSEDLKTKLDIEYSLKDLTKEDFDKFSSSSQSTDS